jgi:hypothetical protein
MFKIDPPGQGRYAIPVSVGMKSINASPQQMIIILTPALIDLVNKPIYITGGCPEGQPPSESLKLHHVNGF